MNKDEVILMTTFKNARMLLNSVTCEVVNVSEDNNINMNEIIGDFVAKLGAFERYLEKSKKEREQ